MINFITRPRWQISRVGGLILSFPFLVFTSCESHQSSQSPQPFEGTVAVDFSNDGQLLAVIARKQKRRSEGLGGIEPLSSRLVLYNPATMKHIVSNDTKPLTDRLKLAPDKRWVVVRTTNDTMSVWDVATRKKHGDFKYDGSIISPVGFTLDGKFLLVEVWIKEDHGEIRLWNFKTETKKGQLFIKEKSGISLATLSERGERIAYVLPYAKPAQVVQVTGFPSGKRISQFAVDADITDLTFSPDGKLLAVGRLNDGVVEVRSANTGRLECKLQHPTKRTRLMVQFTEDSSGLLSGTYEDGTIAYWELTKQKKAAVFHHGEEMAALAVWPSHKKLFSFSGLSPTVKIWDLKTKTAKTVSIKGQ